MLQLLAGFFASAGFGILFNIPKKIILPCGFAGMAGWGIYYWMTERGGDLLLASFVASFFITLLSHLFARRFKEPVIGFIVCGIIPLVPGGFAYDAMRNFVSNQYDFAIERSAQVMLIAGAIAMGIVFSEVLFRMYQYPFRKRGGFFRTGGKPVAKK